MQLLERTTRRKWTVWVAKGQSRHDVDEELEEIQKSLVASKQGQTKMNGHIYDFFNMSEAEAKFEDTFRQHTGNKWSEKDYFKEKPGKYKLLDKHKKK